MRRTRLRQPGNRLFLVFRRKSPPRLLCHLVPPGRYSIYRLVRDPGAMSIWASPGTMILVAGRTTGPRFSPPSPTAGTTNAAFQIGSIRAAVSLYPRHRLQHFNVQRHLISPKNIAPVSQPSNGPVAKRCRLSLSSMQFAARPFNT